MSVVNIARASLDHLHAELQARYNRVKASLGTLKHQDSEYANQHRLLLAAYSDLLAVAAEHLGRIPAAVPPRPAPVTEVADGPPCPVCCMPSWRTEKPRVWRCTKPGCLVSIFSVDRDGGIAEIYTNPEKDPSRG